MATVVILGCSTSGKSSAARRLIKAYGDKFEVIDTDAVVASDPEFDGHLYAMYLKFVRGNDASACRLFLEIGERTLLRKLRSKDNPCLIAAGPNVPFREPEWTDYLQLVRPICFYFRLSAEQLFKGLRKRRIRQKYNQLDLCPGFGCWDEGLGTVFNEHTGDWDELSFEEAMPLIENHLRRVEPVYMAACEPQNIIDVGSIKQDADLQNKVSRLLHEALRWNPVATYHDNLFQNTFVDF